MMSNMASEKNTKAIADHRGAKCHKETSTEKKARKKRRKDNLSQIMDIANAARKEGLSYGQYVSKYGL